MLLLTIFTFALLGMELFGADMLDSTASDHTHVRRPQSRRRRRPRPRRRRRPRRRPRPRRFFFFDSVRRDDPVPMAPERGS